MRKLSLFIVGLVIVLLVSQGLVSAQSASFVADLSGSQQVSPVETDATGQATFQLDPDSTVLSFTLTVVNIEDVLASHIHCASAAENGPPGVTLSGGAPGPINGTLAEGIITAPDPGNGCGWADFAAMTGAMMSGNTYVQVHTASNPSGEIRGQIR